MIGTRGTAVALMILAAALGSRAARAEDHLRVAAGSKGSWDTAVAMLGQRKGFFKDAGLELDIFYDDGSPVTLQAVASGSADVGVGVNVIGLIGAAAKGAPVKMIASSFEGAPDMIFYVRADSPLHSFADITTETVGYSSKGAFNHIVALALLDAAHVTGRLVPVGTESATLTQVLSGQLDVGHDGTGGLGEAPFKTGAVRVIAVGSDASVFRGVTVRGLVSNDATLATRRDALARFLGAYRRTIAWMYADPLAAQWLAEADDTTPAQVQAVVARYYPQDAMCLGPLQQVDRSVELGLAFHRLDAAPTPAALAGMFDLVDPTPVP